VSRRALAIPFGHAVATAVALALVPAGCAQILGFTQDYYQTPDGPTGMPGDGPVENGDANSEGSPALDAGDASDSNVVGEEGGRDGGTFCETLSPQPFFCADFDEGETSPFGWSQAQIFEGTLGLYTTEHESAPASLLARTSVVTAMGKNTNPNTAVYQTLQISGQMFAGTLDFYMHVDQVDAVGDFAVLAQFGLTDPAGGGVYYLQLVTTSNGAMPLGVQMAEDYFSMGTNGSPTDYPVFGVIPLMTWTHVQLSLAVPFAGGPGTATLVLDDGQPTTVLIHAPVPVQAFSPEIAVGVTWASTPSNGWTVAYDNVFFDNTSH
jgi:hypothetical protein